METTTQAVTLALLRRLVSDGSTKRLRLRARLSLADVGRAVGVDPSTVWAWEETGRLPRSDAALRYASLLGELLEAGVAE